MEQKPIDYYQPDSKFQITDLSNICSYHFADFYAAHLNVLSSFPECEEESNPLFVGVIVPQDFDCCGWIEEFGYEVKPVSTQFISDTGDEYDDIEVFYVYKKQQQ